MCAVRSHRSRVRRDGFGLRASGGAGRRGRIPNQLPAPRSRTIAVSYLSRPGGVDVSLLFCVVALLSIGLVMVFSASAVKSAMGLGDPFYYLKRQALYTLIGVTGMVAASNVDYRRVVAMARPALAAGVVMLCLVLVEGIGRSARGSRRWLGYGSLAFQPSEVIKLVFVVFLAWSLARYRGKIPFFRGIVPHMLLCGVLFLLILQQPDLGTAAALAGTTLVLLFVGGASVLHLVVLAAAAIPVAYWAIFSAEYRRRRFLAFLNPWADVQGSGYHIIQSLYALGSGGLFGVGLGASRQKFYYLPEEHTDFILAIIGEELGFLGTFTVLCLFLFFAWRGYRIAMSAPDRLGSLLAAGVTTMIALQAIVNVGVVTATLPITGIPLPFVSFGGSSLVFSLFGVGLLLNVSRYSRIS